MLNFAAGSQTTGYNLTRSLRFRASASASLSRTPATATNRQKFTYSGWVKRGSLGSTQTLMSVYADSINFCWIRFTASDTLDIGNYNANSLVLSVITTQVFRDPSAWYHIVVALDTTQATASNRLLVYVNGVQVTSFGTATYPSQNTNLYWNFNAITRLGAGDFPSFPNQFDGYVAELNYVDGQQLTPSSFGETNALTGVWQPKAYTGSYGTNGFYLPFTDNSALTTSSNVGLGKDFSGNGNYWTTNNISITSGVTYDSMTDVPTLTSATAANYAVLNPLANGAAVPSGGNLNHAVGGSITRCNSTIMVSSGKWYFEVTLNTAGTNTTVGIGQNNITNQYPGQDILSFAQEIDNARKINNDVPVSYGTALTAGQVFMCAIDLDNLKLFFGSQGTWFASSDPVTGTSPAYTLTAGLYCPISRPFGGSAAVSINFGQRPFAYTPPTGFVALNTFNLPAATIVKGSDNFNIALDTGANIKTATEALFPSNYFEWIKDRANANNHQLIDIVRGSTAVLQSNTTAAETTYTAPSGSSVGWVWKAGGAAVSNTDGTITSQVSANASAGFSVVTYTGNGTAGATIGHGLGVAPSFGIFKNRAAAVDWQVYHSALGGNAALFLNNDAAANTSSIWWNNIAPTSSVMTLGTSGYVNGSGNSIVGYLWSEIAGFSKFGSYSTNASADGPFIYTGFRPRWILLKATTTVSGGNWVLIDTARDTYNVSKNFLFANASFAEASYVNVADTLSNGFKIRANWDTVNSSGATMVYACFAENPFKFSLAR